MKIEKKLAVDNLARSGLVFIEKTTFEEGKSKDELEVKMKLQIELEELEEKNKTLDQ